MPVPSTMMGLSDAVMGVSYFWAVRVENFIIGTGADAEDLAHGLVLQQALQRSGDNALLAVGTVVSGDVDVVLVESSRNWSSMSRRSLVRAP